MGRNKSGKRGQATSLRCNSDSDMAKGMAKRKTFLIQWSELSEIHKGFGHGVEFHSEMPTEARTPTLIAFLEGYEQHTFAGRGTERC